MICGACGHENPAAAKFCAECGGDEAAAVARYDDIVGPASSPTDSH